MSFLRTGVIGSSLLENERRVPIHPRHLPRIPAAVRRDLVIESGYGRRFAVGDEHLGTWCGALASREELLRDCELVILPKPVLADLIEIREGGILWGWSHCVQQSEVTQLAIDRHLTLIAFEAMFHWQENGLGDAVCYAVDHTPSYLWDSASWEISEALLPFLATVMAGPQSWRRSPTIRRALEIRNGEICNPDILSFQGREADYPYARKARR